MKTAAINDLPTHARIGDRRYLNSIAFSQGLAATSSKPARARQRERGWEAHGIATRTQRKAA